MLQQTRPSKDFFFCLLGRFFGVNFGFSFFPGKISAFLTDFDSSLFPGSGFEN
jgi:hypothetical protein